MNTNNTSAGQYCNLCGKEHLFGTSCDLDTRVTKYLQDLNKPKINNDLEMIKFADWVNKNYILFADGYLLRTEKCDLTLPYLQTEELLEIYKKENKI